MWRTAILPQVLYGCEIRNVTFPQLQRLWARGKGTIPKLLPIQLNSFAAAEIRDGLPLGDHAIRNPEIELLLRRLRWLQSVGNDTSIVGTLHRELACGPGGAWVEPSVALSGALSWMQWQVRKNSKAFCATRWPVLEAEPRYNGSILYTPSDEPAPSGAVWTDGSLGSSGGAAALQWHSDAYFQAQVPFACWWP